MHTGPARKFPLQAVLVGRGTQVRVEVIRFVPQAPLLRDLRDRTAERRGGKLGVSIMAEILQQQGKGFAWSGPSPVDQDVGGARQGAFLKSFLRFDRANGRLSRRGRC